jgi:hypothetical protein
MTLRDAVTEVRVTESMPLAVGNWLLGHREKYSIYPSRQDGSAAYDPVTLYANFAGDYPMNVLGLLYRSSVSVRRRFLWVFPYTTEVCQYLHIGILSIAGKGRWSLKIYGRNFVPACIELVRGIEDTFKVEVAMKLVEEKPHSVTDPFRLITME